MPSKRTLIVLAAASFCLMVVYSFLLNVVSTWWTDALRPYALWVYAGLGLALLLSLVVLIRQIGVEQRDRRSAKESSVKQTAANGGKIVGSPITLDGAAGEVEQTAKDQGSIKDSPITIR